MENDINTLSKKDYVLKHEHNFWFAPLTQRRKELRREWNELKKENKSLDYYDFLFDYELKANKINDALPISIVGLSFQEIKNLYLNLYPESL